MNKSLLVFSLLLLFGCDFGGGKKNNTKLHITSSFAVTGEAGGTILYILNKDLNTQRSIIVDSDQVVVQLANGNWDFALLSWDGSTPMGGNLKCAQKTAKLEDVDTDLTLSLTAAACDNDYFSPTGNRSASLIKELRLINCQDSSTATANSNCNSVDRGFAGSYKVKLLPHLELPVAQLGSIDLEQTTQLESGCIAGIAAPNSVTDANIRLPFGSANFRPAVLIEAFSDGVCTNDKKKYFLRMILVKNISFYQ